MALQMNSTDGYVSFESGMNESVDPSLIPPTQTRRNVNVTVKNKFIRPRPAYRELPFSFASESIAKKSPAIGALSYEQNFKLGRVQHIGKYQTTLAEYIILVINGVIYAVDIKRRLIHVVKVSGTQKIANYLRTRIHGTQAHLYYVLFDWPHQPIAITEELTARRTYVRNQEIPRSFLGAYVHNRLFVANAGIEFGASDPVRPDAPDAPLTFKESIVGENNPSPAYPDQFFSLSYIERLSPITAMGYLQQTDGTSALGFGPLFVSTKEAIHLFVVNKPRANWDDGQLGSAYIFNYGIVGPKAFTNVGSDLFYRASDGRIYSTGTLYSDQRRWGNTDISQEIEPSLRTTNLDHLQYSFMEYFDNRVLTSLRPVTIPSRNLFGAPIEDYCSNGLGALEFHSVSGVTASQTNPVWGGIYSGIFSGLVAVGGKLYSIGKRSIEGGPTVIQEITTDHFRDQSVSGTTRPIRSRVYTREFQFESPIQDKIVQQVKLSFKNIIGPLFVAVHMRDTEASDWQLFGKIESSGAGHRKYSIQDEVLSRDEYANGRCKSAQFRVDIVGDMWELTQMIAIADLETDVLPTRKYDVSTDECKSRCVEVSGIEDFQL